VKSVDNAHVLVVPSRYGDMGMPPLGGQIRAQAALTQKLGVKTGVVFPDLRTALGTRPAEWVGRRFQFVEEMDDGVLTLRVMGWTIPGAKRLTRELWVSQVHRLIKKYIRKHGVPDLLHAHCVHEAGVAALTAKRDWRIPFIVTEHVGGCDWGALPDEMLARAMDVFSHADRIVTVNRTLAGDIKTYVGNRDITVIPNVADTAYYTPPDNPRTATPFRFLSLGDLCVGAGGDTLLRAFAGAFGSKGDVRLQLVGDGMYRSELEGLAAQLGVSGQIEFLGILSRNQLREAMRRNNAAICAGAPVPQLIDAMATGLPAIVAGEESLTEDVGRLVALDDAGELQDAMEQMVNSYDRWRESGPAIRSYVEQNFGERTVGAKLIETYNSVIQQ
jgi:glycosyltransferase involved in cell wall biosynthesis